MSQGWEVLGNPPQEHSQSQGTNLVSRAVVGDSASSVKSRNTIESHYIRKEGPGERRKGAQGGRPEHNLPISILGLLLLSSLGVPKVCPDEFRVSQVIWFSACFQISEKAHGTRHISLHRPSVVYEFLCLWSSFNM